MKRRLKVERGSGNVFRDVGFPRTESQNLVLRAELMSRIRRDAAGLTQAAAAERFGVSQPRMNDLMRGRIEKFSLDALVNMLGHANIRVVMKVAPQAARKVA